jgi:ribonucleoside-triphosphate reductase
VRPGRFLLAFRLGEASPGAEARRVLGAIADLYERGERIEFLPPAAGPERRGLTATGAKITLNLPRAAFRSARDRRSSLEREIEEALDLAIKAHLERRRFLERLGANRESPLWDLLGRGAGPHVALEAVEFRIGVLGLNECLKFLTGSEMHQDPATARLGIEVARAARRKVRREERSLGIRLVLEETANVGPLRALERGDRAKHPQMAEVDRGRQPQWGPAYTTGVRLHRMAPVDPLRRVEELAAYLPFVEPAGGLIEEFPELRRSASEILPALLEDSLEPAARGAMAGLS